MSVGRAGLAAIALVAACLAAIGGAARARADCDGPFPDFADVARTATRIVIGEVARVRPGGAWPGGPGALASRFTLQVTHVVRGEPIAFLDVDDLETSPCAAVVGVRPGDRIALAIGGRDFSPPMEVSMVAWIDAVPPEGFGPGGLTEAETLTVDAVYALAGQAVPEPTAVVTPPAFDPADPTAPRSDPPWLGMLGGVAGIAALALAIVGLRRRVRPGA
jgi:hypothetical protein